MPLIVFEHPYVVFILLNPSPEAVKLVIYVETFSYLFFRNVDAYSLSEVRLFELASLEIKSEVLLVNWEELILQTAV